MKFNVYGGADKVPTGTYVDHAAARVDSSKFIDKVEWVFDGSGDKSFYIDDAISLVPNNNEEKYAWLLEGKEIIPWIYADVEQNLERYLTAFKYIFTSDRNLYDRHERIKFIPANCLWVKNLDIYKKTKLVSMISSNNSYTAGHINRMIWVARLRDSVDLYGRGINPVSMKEDALRDYMFSVAIENASYDTYFTEKILDCFATGTIPIYLGCKDIGNHFNLDGIIILDDTFDVLTLTKELYESKLPAIQDNFNRVSSYKVLENFISEFF